MTIEEDLREIQKRNARVEADKAWEISWERRALLLAITYIFSGLFMTVAGMPNPWIGAFVPTAGYLLSTLSLPYAKFLWIKYCYSRQES